MKSMADVQSALKELSADTIQEMLEAEQIRANFNVLLSLVKLASQPSIMVCL
ncbi:hypothetical protein [Paenibacillus xerothermodurans]|uniref:hypothetical protein n=1 Tax=Paenibacillus xerothermodurans TaxID=1977292 RepID=UPI001FB46635|nr:hypothetical protein [Paenibacillus xerothermodurans]